MKFAQIGIPLLKRCIEIYMNLAFGDGWREADFRVPFAIGEGDTLEKVLVQFRDESIPGEGDQKKIYRYTLQLGNSRYPFMKLVLHEHLIRGEYFFSVDTHDALNVKPSYPDYMQWVELKKFNGRLKQEIEDEWSRSGIPTSLELKRLAQEACPGEEAGARGCILVVDDEREIAESLSSLLRGEGYGVKISESAEEALEEAERITPDLILTDYEMPGMDGLELCQRIRSNSKLKRIPILLATGGSIDLSNLNMINGFMVKPYQKEILFSFIQHLLKRPVRFKKHAREP